MLRQGVVRDGGLLELMVDMERTSVKSHTAILPSVAALNSNLHLREDVYVGHYCNTDKNYELLCMCISLLKIKYLQ